MCVSLSNNVFVCFMSCLSILLFAFFSFPFLFFFVFFRTFSNVIRNSNIGPCQVNLWLCGFPVCIYRKVI